MDKLDILFWVLGTGFALVGSLFLLIWNTFNHRFDRLECRIDKVDEKLTDVDRCLCRLEGAFSLKDCCMIKDERQNRKLQNTE